MGKFAGEIDVDDAAADGEIAGDFHRFQPVVAVLGEPDDELFGRRRLPGPQRQDIFAELISRRDGLHEGLDGSHQGQRCAGGTGGEVGQKLEPRGDLLVADVAQGGPPFQSGDDEGAAAVEEFHVVGQIVGFIDVPADDEDGAL